jgi:hypothetical protein
MQAQNVTEYLEIRKEIADLKDCITTYVGFVLAGSATAVWGLAGRTSDSENGHIAMALASIFLSFVSIFVLFLLSYKFTSHNRYVGYSKLLTHEEFKLASLMPDNLFLWEVCMDKVRDCHYQSDLLSQFCEDVQSWTFGVHNLKERVQDQLDESRKYFRWLRGALLLIGAGDKGGSWKFPVYVARIFVAVNVILALFESYFLWAAPNFYRLRLLALSLSFVLVISWMFFFSKLYEQMSGVERVESFCWRFAPIRAKFLRELDHHFEYHLHMVSNTVAKTKVASK